MGNTGNMARTVVFLGSGVSSNLKELVASVYPQKQGVSAMGFTLDMNASTENEVTATEEKSCLLLCLEVENYLV